MTRMNASRPSRGPDESGFVSVIWFAAVFAMVTYAAISVRAVLNPFEVHNFIDAKRAISVVLGAIILWVAIRAAERTNSDSFGAQVFAILNIALTGAICLLLAREAYDLAASGEFAQRSAVNVRWILTWIGYFTAAVAGFLALGFYRELQAIRAQSRGFLHKSAEPDPGAELGYEVADIEFDPRSPA